MEGLRQLARSKGLQEEHTATEIMDESDKEKEDSKKKLSSKLCKCISKCINNFKIL